MKAYDLRARRGDVTQEELRKEMGWNAGTVTDIENGSIGIDQETYDKTLSGIARLKALRREREEVTA